MKVNGFVVFDSDTKTYYRGGGQFHKDIRKAYVYASSSQVLQSVIPRIKIETDNMRKNLEVKKYEEVCKDV